MGKFKRVKPILGRIGSIQKNVENTFKKIHEIEQQYETPAKVDPNIPSHSEGTDGDKKLIKEGNDSYLYIKINNRWMKTQLQEI